MIYGIGVDLVDIRRIEKALERWGDRFVKRVFTETEAQACLKKPYPPSPFALRFAAKEAFSKALGLGMRRGLRWRDIEVFHSPGGRPGLKLQGASSDICQKHKISRLHLSLSDDGRYGVAMVILEESDETGQGR
ncbi:MAG: holo-ACP synthase [Proteobacteria bacterium]|nr:holo-ACP synthase [Pseudomonadota bacterium]